MGSYNLSRGPSSHRTMGTKLLRQAILERFSEHFTDISDIPGLRNKATFPFKNKAGRKDKPHLLLFEPPTKTQFNSL